MPHDLNDYLQQWELSNPQLLAQTATSSIYTVLSESTMVILKLLTPLGEVDERRGAIALRYFDGHGAVRLLRADDRAQLLEYAEGEDLTPMVKRGEDEQAALIIAEVISRLHTPRNVPSDGLTPLGVWFRALFDHAEKDRRQGVNSIFVRGAGVAKRLLDSPRDVCVLHGDIHHWNIRHSTARGWLAFDPKGLYGERTYDAANTLCNPDEMPSLVANEARLLKIASILAEKLTLDFSRLAAFTFAYACLSASWSLSDHQDATLALQVAEMMEAQL